MCREFTLLGSQASSGSRPLRVYPNGILFALGSVMCERNHEGMRSKEVFHRLKAIGTMRVPPSVDGEAGYTLVMANCPRCGTTLAIELTDEKEGE